MYINRGAGHFVRRRVLARCWCSVGSFGLVYVYRYREDTHGPFIAIKTFSHLEIKIFLSCSATGYTFSRTSESCALHEIKYVAKGLMCAVLDDKKEENKWQPPVLPCVHNRLTQSKIIIWRGNLSSILLYPFFFKDFFFLNLSSQVKETAGNGTSFSTQNTHM